MDQIKLDYVSATFLLIGACVLGQILQGFGSIIEKVYYNKKGSRYPSVLYLKEESKFFSDEFKSKLKERISKKFEVSHDLPLQEMFNLCYRYVIQEGREERAEKFLSIHGFYRGLTVAALIAFVSSLINIYYQHFSNQSLLMGIVMFFFTIQFFYRYIGAGRTLVHEVYLQFYIHATTEQNPKRPSSSSEHQKP